MHEPVSAAAKYREMDRAEVARRAKELALLIRE